MEPTQFKGKDLINYSALFFVLFFALLAVLADAAVAARRLDVGRGISSVLGLRL